MQPGVHTRRRTWRGLGELERYGLWALLGGMVLLLGLLLQEMGGPRPALVRTHEARAPATDELLMRQAVNRLYADVL